MRNIYLKKALLLFFIFFQLTKINGQTSYTDVAAKTADQLVTYGKVNLTSFQYIPPMTCEDCPLVKSPGGLTKPTAKVIRAGRTVKTIQQEYLKASNIRIISIGDISWGTDQIKQLPTTAPQENSTICDNFDEDQPQTFTGNMSISYQRTASLSFTQSVVNTTSRTIDGQYKLDPFQIGITAQIGQSISSGTTTIDANSVTITVTRGFQSNLAPHTGCKNLIRVWTVQHQISFSCNVVVDADLSTNDNGYKNLSDLIPIEQRTYIVSGILTANDCSDAELKSVPLEPVNDKK